MIAVRRNEALDVGLDPSRDQACEKNGLVTAGAHVLRDVTPIEMVQGWAAARNQARRLMMRVRLSYRQRATWQGRRRGTWLRGSGLARRVFGSQMEASTVPVLLSICPCHWLSLRACPLDQHAHYISML